MDPAALDLIKRVLDALKEHGLLLESDPKLPSVTGLAAEAPVRGSWWGHPQGHLIFDVLTQLSHHRDVLFVKLISGKVTLVHRKLWPAILAVATADEPWQTEGLSPAARRLLKQVQKEGELRTDQIAMKTARPGDAARELEARLLVHSEQVHTERGSHAKRLETWQRWAKRVGLRRKPMTAEAGRRQLQSIVEELNEKFGAKGKVPWE